MSVSLAFPNITADQWARIKAVLSDKTGIVIASDAGTQRFGRGLLHYDVTWNYTPAALTIAAEPDGWISRQSCADVQSGIRQAIEKIILGG